MDIILDYIESLALWRAHRIAASPTRMSRNPIMRDDYAGVGDPTCRVNVLATPLTAVPPIAFDACSQVPVRAINAYIRGTLDSFTLSDEYVSYAEKSRHFTISALNVANRYISNVNSRKRLHSVRFVPDFDDKIAAHILISRAHRGLDTKYKDFRCVSGTVPSGNYYKLIISSSQLRRYCLPKELTLHILSPELIVTRAAYVLKKLCYVAPCCETSKAQLLLVHNIIALVDELCGTYGYDPLTGTAVTYGLNPLTSLSKIKHQVSKFKYIQGGSTLLAALKYCHNNVASPFEEFMASALMLPEKLGGIGFPQLEINKTQKLNSSSALIPEHSWITPDLSSKALKLVIECNGRAYHNSSEAFLEDQRRIRDYASLHERHVPLSVSDVNNTMVLSRTMLGIVAACQDKLGRSKTYRIRTRINNPDNQIARKIMIDLHLS